MSLDISLFTCCLLPGRADRLQTTMERQSMQKSGATGSDHEDDKKAV